MRWVLVKEPHLTTVGCKAPRQNKVPLSSVRWAVPFFRLHLVSESGNTLKAGTRLCFRERTVQKTLEFEGLVGETGSYSYEGQHICLRGPCFSPLFSIHLSLQSDRLYVYSPLANASGILSKSQANKIPREVNILVAGNQNVSYISPEQRFFQICNLKCHSNQCTKINFIAIH